MNKSTFHIKQMDCSAEEQLVRMKLEPLPLVQSLNFDLPNRTLYVYHTGNVQPIEQAISTLQLGDTFQGTEAEDAPVQERSQAQRTTLIIVLQINAGLFIAEMTAGLMAQSMGLVADSLDMLADAIVYGLSLYAVGKAVTTKKGIATASGYFQLALAILGFGEIIRRFLGYGEIPHFQTMLIVATIALVGNAICLLLLNRQKSQEAHMKASWIFTTNDIIVNLGVITAGALVWFLDSRIPDLAIGVIVFAVVIRGAVRILKIGKA